MWVSEVGVDERYRGMVERLEREAAAHPVRYARRVIAAAFLGYGFIGLVLAALIGTVAAMVMLLFTAHSAAALEIKVALVCGLVAFAILRSLAVKFDPVEGRRLSASEAPALFDMIERLRATTGGPAIHEVVINGDFNAAIMQHPRFAFLGSRNILILGLPLMQALSKEEVAAVIAHELGHSVGSHGRWAAFVYLVRQRWFQISQRLPQGWTAGILRKFFSWYGPWFNAYSFVLARRQEYEADRTAALATDPDTMGAALVRLRILGDHFENSWTKVWSEAADREAPSAMPFRRVGPQLFSNGADHVPSALDAAMRAPTGLDDTHPCLADRLHALGHEPKLPEPADDNAAASLLGPLAERIADALDCDWWEANRDWWGSIHEGRQADKAELAELAARLDEQVLTAKQQLRHAELVRTVEGDAAAVPHLRKLLDAFPAMHDARFQLGYALLDSGDDAGIEELERAWQGWPSLQPPGIRRIIDHLTATDRHESAQTWFGPLEEAETRQAMAEEEFHKITQKDELHPLAIEETDRTALADALAKVADLKKIHAARRKLRHGDRDQIVFVFRTASGRNAEQVLDELGPLLLEHGDTLGFEFTSNVAWLERKITKIPDALLFQRPP